MKLKIIKLFLVFSILFLSACSRPDPVLHDTQGQPVQLSKLKGQWVIVNFWAAWCEACLEEIPQLNLFYEHTKNKDIAFYGANYDGVDLEEMKKLARKLDMQYPLIQEEANSAWRLGEVTVLPTTFILDPKGKLVAKLQGGTLEGKLMEELEALRRDYKN